MNRRGDMRSAKRDGGQIGFQIEHDLTWQLLIRTCNWFVNCYVVIVFTYCLNHTSITVRMHGYVFVTSTRFDNRLGV